MNNAILIETTKWRYLFNIYIAVNPPSTMNSDPVE